MAGTTFSPSTLTIPAGTTVTFTDTSGHTVTEGTDGTAVDDPIVDEEGGSDDRRDLRRGRARTTSPARSTRR